MAWQNTRVTLACGCEGVGAWDRDWPGDEQKCSRHGLSSIHRISRIHEARPSRDMQLGLKEDA